MRYSKGVMWLDDCRIPFADTEDIDFTLVERQSEKNKEYFYEGGFGKEIEKKIYKSEGRFTPNLLVCDDMLNDGSISKSNSGGISSGKNFGGLTEKYRDRKGVDDKGSNSRYYDLDLWFDKMLERL